MTSAGPVEFSVGEMITILLAMVAMALALPLLVGAISVVVYRRRTPEAERSAGEAVSIFFRNAALAMVVQIAIGIVIGVISDLIG